MSSERTEIATVRISAGRRTYFFDVKESSDGNRYLWKRVVSESTIFSVTVKNVLV